MKGNGPLQNQQLLTQTWLDAVKGVQLASQRLPAGGVTSHRHHDLQRTGLQDPHVPGQANLSKKVADGLFQVARWQRLVQPQRLRDGSRGDQEEGQAEPQTQTDGKSGQSGCNTAQKSNPPNEDQSSV